RVGATFAAEASTDGGAHASGAEHADRHAEGAGTHDGGGKEHHDGNAAPGRRRRRRGPRSNSAPTAGA
ncbi:MAG: ATP-dependent helicase, partial [Microbacterium sp.]